MEILSNLLAFIQDKLTMARHRYFGIGDLRKRQTLMLSTSWGVWLAEYNGFTVYGLKKQLLAAWPKEELSKCVIKIRKKSNMDWQKDVWTECVLFRNKLIVKEGDYLMRLTLPSGTVMADYTGLTVNSLKNQLLDNWSKEELSKPIWRIKICKKSERAWTEYILVKNKLMPGKKEGAN